MQTTGKSDSGNSVATDALVPSGADAAVPVTKDLQHSDGDPDKDNGDFIALDSREDLPEIDDARYFDNVDSKKAYGNMLQTKMEEDPTNTDAWLLLAIYQLELVVGVRYVLVLVKYCARFYTLLTYIDITFVCL